MPEMSAGWWVYTAAMKQHPLEALAAVATSQAGKVYEFAQTRKGGGNTADKAQTRVARQGSLLDSVGFALGGLTTLQTSILLLKYGSGGDREWLRVLNGVRAVIARTYRETLVRHMNRTNQTKLRNCEPSQDMQNAMAVTVVAEYIQTHTCQWCQGTREVWEQDKRVDCSSCGGKGRMNWTAEYRARMMGVSRTTYYRYLWLHAAAMRMLIISEADAVVKLRARMK